jgi:hypothetical protein
MTGRHLSHCRRVHDPVSFSLCTYVIKPLGWADFRETRNWMPRTNLIITNTIEQGLSSESKGRSVSQEIPCCYGTRVVIAVFTRTRLINLHTLISLRFISIPSSHLRQAVSSLVVFRLKFCIHLSPPRVSHVLLKSSSFI